MKMEQTLPAELREARRRFEDWRRKKIKGSTIPEPLWEGAAKLAAIHGVSRVSHLLSLDYYNLKERAKAAESKAQCDDRAEQDGVHDEPTLCEKFEHSVYVTTQRSALLAQQRQARNQLLDRVASLQPRSKFKTLCYSLEKVLVNSILGWRFPMGIILILLHKLFPKWDFPLDSLETVPLLYSTLWGSGVVDGGTLA